MWRIRNEEWERRKSYLVRSLFEDVLALSPIAETRESNISSAESRAYSPLPDFIIEKEPNRYDESDEYYEGLAVRMRKLYKILFHGVEDEACEGTVELDESFDTNNDYMELEENVLDVNSSQSNLDTSANDSDKSDESRMNRVSDAHDTLTESQYSIPTTDTEYSKTYEIIVTQAIMHAEPAGDDREDFNNNMIAHQGTSRSMSTEGSLIIDLAYQDEQRKVTDFDRLVSTQATTQIKTDIEETTLQDDSEGEIEAMRGPSRRTTSEGSILKTSTVAREKEILTPIAQSERRMSMIQNTESPIETEVDSHSSDGSHLNQAFLSSKRTRSVSWSDDSQTKKIRYDTKSVQTDPVKNIPWEDIQGDFFLGKPLIYKLVKLN